MRYLIALIAALLAVFGFATRASASPQVTTEGSYGYDVTGSTYTSSTADWTMPSYTCGSKTNGTSLTIWTGLDGLTSATVEQIGAGVECVSGTDEYYGWYEMYPGPVETFSNALSTGDELEASVTYDGSSKFTLTLDDVTAGWDKTVTASLTAARSSAETIVEAPNTLSCTPHKTLASFTDDTVNGKALGSLSPALLDSGDPNIAVSAVSGKSFTVTCT